MPTLSPKTKQQINTLVTFLDTHEPLWWTKPSIDDLGTFLNLDHPDNIICRENPWNETIMQVFSRWMEAYIDETTFINRLHGMLPYELSQVLAFPLEISCGDMASGHGSAGGSLSVWEIIQWNHKSKKTGYENASPVYEKSIQLIFGPETKPKDVTFRLGSAERRRKAFPDILNPST
jgi:hypothetical protein